MNKKKFKLLFLLVILCLTLSVALSGCMMVNMSKEKILKRLSDEQYKMSYLSSTAWTADYRNYNININEIVSAAKGTAEGTKAVYLYFCGNSKSVEWVAERCKANSATAPEGAVKNYIIYKYPNKNLVMYGDYESVALARNY